VRPGTKGARRLSRHATVALLVWLTSAGQVGAQQPARARTGSDVRGTATPDSLTSMYDVGGIRVIQRSLGGDIVVANLYLLGGSRQVTFDNAGIEPLLLEASERGTRSYPREKLRRGMARLGTSIVTSAATDWTSFGIRATRSTLDSTWAIFASRVMEPTLDPADVELVRQQQLLAVSQRRDSPDALLEYLADSVAFAGHPYAVPPTGTEQSVQQLTAAQLKTYHDQTFVKSRMMLVVVGDVPRTKVERLVTQTLARLPAGSYTWTLPDTLPHSKSSVYAVSRPLPTNYILGRYAGPKAGTKDYYALRVATAVLGGQLFGEIRSRRNLTYAVDAPFEDHAVSSGGLYVTTAQPEITIDVMRQQLTAIRTGNIDPDALGRLVQQFLTQFFLDNESNADQADFLARSYLYEGSLDAADRFEAQLRAVRPADIRDAAQKYFRDVKWVYVGDTTHTPTRAMERY
jgi:zinc protease